MRPITFKIERQLPNSLARAGVLSTPHGDIETPSFTVVATKATAKGVDQKNWPELGVQAIIANTYHLYLSPGEDLVEKAGGLHTFMNFSGPIMTDSGGFQVFSLGAAFGKSVSKFLPEDQGPESASPSVHLGSSQRSLREIPGQQDVCIQRAGHSRL